MPVARRAGCSKFKNLKSEAVDGFPTARVKIKTPVTHRTRSRLAAAMHATAATTDAHGHIGTFEWRGPSRTVRVRLLGRLKTEGQHRSSTMSLK